MKENLKKPKFGVKTEWVPVEALPVTPDGIKEIAIDLETKDPRLRSHGPGWPTGNGEVVGIAIAYEGFNSYFPFGHEGGGNLDKGHIKKWFTREIAKYPADKIFHNAAYDVGWLRRLGIKVEGRLIDTMLAAPLIDENRRYYSLNAVCYAYLGEMKSEAALREAAAEFGVDPKAEMYKLPAAYVGEYAEADARLTLELWQHLKALLSQEDLWQIFDLEAEVLPLCIEMTWNGVRIDLEKAERLKQKLLRETKAVLSKIKKETGVAVELWAAASISKVFDYHNIPYGRTKTGLPSFTKNFLQNHPHPVAQQIAQARETDKIGNTFLSSIFRYAEKGRIHGHINQLRSEGGGTVTGRLSMANPNLQQIPARNPRFAKAIRGLFLPEESEKFASLDYSQQEPRILVHYASLTGKRGLTGSDLFVQAYREDPKTDFHQMVADIAKIPRRQAKTINLALLYGMGQTKLAEQLDLTPEEAKEIISQYHVQVPFVKELQDFIQRRVGGPMGTGFVRSLLGRKCRFNLWEPNLFVSSKALPKEQAVIEYGSNIKRAYTYRALNRLIQSSAADQTKRAMVEIYKTGKVPLIQIHDELAFSVKDLKEAQEIQKIMENAVELKVPSPTDISLGETWGTLQVA
jgi:DNA polymerase I-like protein with 3'-5' exonuclease and polymerase domains